MRNEKEKYLNDLWLRPEQGLNDVAVVDRNGKVTPVGSGHTEISVISFFCQLTN